ncbi:alanyl-tRNA editing protein [Vibrio methylphosphonaticus]|uniref:alanyl-tRNA editing protein n=1 Tax=Vibrio methylphosphonaticus TaxID=2946866 RepID=UPI00202A00FD|nr:alanyl-tRNA editing protein [Vibrio methylphosphonaticus]MCL9775978.1 alanyl-tRNA editing protein [Vibrio methylphosphonaticus]
MITATKTFFCHEMTKLESVVQMQVDSQEYTDVVVESTPFHPVSHIWPDHPADRGWITVDGKRIDVGDCLVGAIELATSMLYVGAAIPVKRDTEGWVFVVVHRLTSRLALTQGQTVTLEVDADYQASLSRGHTAGHIASLALNSVLADKYWRKVADRVDGLGHYDFNSYAQERSEVFPDRCVDLYRLGKTLKKRGLNTADVLSDIVEIEVAVNTLLKQWLSQSSSIQMQLEGPYLTSSRYWQWYKRDELVIMPCGGTHVTSTSSISETQIKLETIESTYIRMHTHVIN